jgi:glycogen(starch) synthase
MRIAVVSPEYPSLRPAGGIGTTTRTLAVGLARHGNDVHVVTGGRPGRFLDEGVRVVALRHRWVPHRAARRLLANRSIAATVASLRPDVVQAAEWEAEAWWLARWTSLPVVTRLDTPTYLLERLNLGRELPRNALLRWLERDQARRSAAVVAPSTSIADVVTRDWGLAGVDVIPNPLDVLAVEEAAADDPPLEPSERSLVFIGRLERRKGLEVLGTALPAVLTAHPRVHVYLIGRDPGEEGGALVERFHRAVRPVEDRVHLMGELPRRAALAMVARATVVVLPSLWENLASACLEALALGRPVIASRAGGFIEMIEHDRSGWLVPPADPVTLARELSARLADEEGLRRVGRGARQRASLFQVDAVVDRMLSLYDRVLRPHRRPPGAEQKR